MCATRDVNYTSLTTSAGTTFNIGDGTPDPAGSILLSHPIQVQVFFGGDKRCTGDGVDPNCVACDGVTPTAAGRIGVLKTAFPVSLLLPLNILWSTGTVENLVVQSGNYLDAREVSGAGMIQDLIASGTYQLAANNAALNIPSPLGAPLNVQFLTKEIRAPVP